MSKAILIAVILLLCLQDTSEAGRFGIFRGGYYDNSNDYVEEPEVKKPMPKKKPKPQPKPKPKVIFQEVKMDYLGISEHYNRFMSIEINPYLSID